MQRSHFPLILAGCCFAFATTQPRDALAAVELPYHNEATRQLLIKALQDEDRIPRVRAAMALSSPAVAGERNQEVLSSLAADPVEAVRRAALSSQSSVLSPQSLDVMALKSGFNPRPHVEETLIKETHRDPRIRQMARLRQLESDPAYKEDFSKLLDDPDYFVRRAVATQVVKKREAASLSIWRKLLASERLNDQIEAAWAVGQLDSKTDELALLKFLDSDSERLRLISVESLERIGGDATRQALATAISKHTAKTQEALLRLAAHLQARPALTLIRELAADKKAVAAPRLLALDAIRAMADGEAQPMLMQMVKNYDFEAPNSALREHAAGALGVVGGAEAVAPLRKLITDKVLNLPMVGPAYDADTTRLACIEALQQLKATDALKTLLSEKFLDDSSEAMRRTLAGALSALTGIAYDYRRAVTFRSYFIESLEPDEYPPALAENLQKPPVFPASATGFKEK